MASWALPPRVERFVGAFIPSVLHLEALLYLRARPEQELTVETVAAALYVAPAAAGRALADLGRHSLVRDTPARGVFAYAPATAELREGVDELADTYRVRLVPLHEFIHSRAAASSIQDFADAFRLRKD